MKWTKEAENSLSKVPFFIKKRVKKRVEDEAEAQGAKEVTVEHVAVCRDRFLNRMEYEVRGFQVESCFGSGDCPNKAMDFGGLVESMEDRMTGVNMKDFLREKVNGPLKMHHEFRISVSGCPNACSRPQITDIGLIGIRIPEISNEECSCCGECVEICKEGAITLKNSFPELDKTKCLLCGQCVKICPTGTLRDNTKGFKIMIGGKLGRHPRLATEIPGIFDAEEVMKKAEEILAFYMENCRAGERLGEVLEKEIF